MLLNLVKGRQLEYKNSFEPTLSRISVDEWVSISHMNTSHDKLTEDSTVISEPNVTAHILENPYSPMQENNTDTVLWQIGGAYDDTTKESSTEEPSTSFSIMVIAVIVMVILLATFMGPASPLWCRRPVNKHKEVAAAYVTDLSGVCANSKDFEVQGSTVEMA